MSEDIRRVRFYQGQYLGADDLEAEQHYHRDLRRRHNVGHHTWGVVTGLELEIEDTNRLWVDPGMAVDGFGREIFVLAPAELGPDDFLAEKLTTGPQPVWLAYHEESAVPARYGYAECEDGTLQRIVEGYRLVVGEPEDPDGRDDVVIAGEPEDTADSIPFQQLPVDEVKARWFVLLGEVFWDTATQTFLTLDQAKRPHAGVVAQTIWAPAGELRLRDRRPAADLHVAVEGRLRVDGVHTARGNIELHGTELVALNADGGGEPVSLGRLDPGGAAGADLRLEVGEHPDPAKANRLAVQSGGADRLTVRQDGTTDVHGDTTIRDGRELRLDGGRLGITREGTNPPNWIVRQPDPADGSALQFRETINEVDPEGRVVFEILQGAGNLADAVLRLQGHGPATLSAAQLVDLTDGGFTTLHQHQFASTTQAGRVEIATSGEASATGGSGAPLVPRADDARLLSTAQKTGLTNGGTTTLHRHSSTFINDTRQVALHATEGGSDIVTVTLPGQRRVLATAMLAGTEEGYGVLGATEYGDAYVEVLRVDGAMRGTWYSGGRHFGASGSTSALRSPSFLGLATSITFRLRAFTGLAWGLGIVFYEQP